MSFLDTLEILQDLTHQEKEKLLLFCQEKHVSVGEVLFYEGEEANAMYILKEGKMSISRSIDGKEIFLGTVSAEEILGEMALFSDNSKRMATAKAAKDSILIVILSFSIKELTQTHPDLMDKIKEIIEQRMWNNKILESK